jgi:hypothetical protein
MNTRTLLFRLAIVAPVSSLVVGCGETGDGSTRSALERDALQRDLDLAIRPDTTLEIALEDVALVDSASLGDADAEGAVAPTPVAGPAPTAPAAQPASTPARRPASPAGPSYVTRTAPSGSTFSVRFSETLSTRTATVGSTFSATLAQAITDAQGRVVFPAGSTVRGRVTRALHATSQGGSADLAVTFTSISHGGQSHPISVSMVAAAPITRVGRASTAEHTAKVTSGAAVGAVAGRVIGGDRRSAVIGAGVGTLAGTAVAVGTNRVDATVPAGATATARLSGPVTVRVPA